MCSFLRNLNSLTGLAKAFDHRIFIEIYRRNNADCLDRQFLNGNPIIRMKRDLARRALHVLGLRCPIPHGNNLCLRQIHSKNHLGQNKTKWHLSVIAFQTSNLVWSRNNGNFDFLPEFPTDIGQRADTRLQTKNRTPSLLIDFDLPGQVTIWVNTLLFSQTRNQKGNHQRSDNEGD